MKGTTKILGLCGAVAVVLSTVSVQAYADNTYYRWADDRGNPVHSDRPPPEGINYEVVSTGSSMVRKVTADEGAVPAEIESRPGNEFSKIDTAMTTIEKNPEYCKRAQDNLETLENFARIRVRNDQGEYRYIDEEEKAEQKAQAREQMRIHCD